MLITRQAGIGDLHFGAQKQKFQWCTMDLKTYPLQRWTQVFESDRGISCFTTQVGATVVLICQCQGFQKTVPSQAVSAAVFNNTLQLNEDVS